MRLPTRLDRYPAKMVSKLADRLVRQYAQGARRILDPFCGSGAVLVAAQRRGIPVAGIDINPVAGLLCRVKLNRFDPVATRYLAQRWIARAERSRRVRAVRWEQKHYWFAPKTIEKFERLRFASEGLHLVDTNEGTAALLSFALAVRLCSRADQRSPKPFISKIARLSRQGKHFDPYRTILALLDELCLLYGDQIDGFEWNLLHADVPNSASNIYRLGKYSHVITSPPYINAQDYFRNFKLELHLLEGVLPFCVDDLREHFIGTERGPLLERVPEKTLQTNLNVLPELERLQCRDPRLAAVVHRYLHDMARSFDVIKRCLDPDGCLVIVCGDNLLGGVKIRTWYGLRQLLEERGFRLFDHFTDQIGDRLLAPKRHGHKGLIKREMVLAFRSGLEED